MNLIALEVVYSLLIYRLLFKKKKHTHTHTTTTNQLVLAKKISTKMVATTSHDIV